MAVLDSWQKPSRVMKYDSGDGASGNATISSDVNTRATITGTAGNNTSTLGSAILQNGDLALLIQSRGTGVGVYEFVKVQSGGGSTSITWTTTLQNSYSGQAQCIKVPRYKKLTVNAYNPTAWNGSLGGIVCLVASKEIIINGSIGNNGRGYVGGAGRSSGSGGYGWYGESHLGASGNSGNKNANGTGGGGGQTDDPNVSNGSGGGNGGYASSGQAGGRAGGGTGGNGGSSVGLADLRQLYFGGGGGGGGSKTTNPSAAGAGGAGGGIIILIAPKITFNTNVTVSGANGVNGINAGTGISGGGGGGAGGSLLVVTQKAILGSNNLLADKGQSGTGNYGIQYASDGRIAVHYKKTISGSTSPAYTGVQDASLKFGGFTPKVAFIS